MQGAIRPIHADSILPFLHAGQCLRLVNQWSSLVVHCICVVYVQRLQECFFGPAGPLIPVAKRFPANLRDVLCPVVTPDLLESRFENRGGPYQSLS